MVGAMLEGSALQPSSTLQQWRQLCYLTTLDLPDAERFLESAAKLLCDGCDANVCVIRCSTPSIAKYEASHGHVSDQMRLLMAQVEARLSPRQLTPNVHALGGAQLVTVPLTLGRERIGMLHLVAADPTIALHDLPVLTVMLTNALARQTTAAQLSRARHRTTQQYVAVQHAVTRVMAEAATINDAVPIILQAFCESLGWEWGAFWNADADGGLLRCGNVWHEEAADLSAFTAFNRHTAYARGVGLPGRVWALGEPVWVADLVQDAVLPEALVAAKDRLRAAFGFPIWSGDRFRGVIVLLSRKTRPSDSELTAMLVPIGGQIGQFIERKEALQQAYDDLELRVVQRTAELAQTNAALQLEVSERKRAEAALQRTHDELEQRVQARTAELARANAELRAQIAGRQAAEERLGTVVANAPITLFALDQEGTFTLAEGQGFEVLGLKPSEVIGRSVLDVYPNMIEFQAHAQAALTDTSLTTVDHLDGAIFETRWSALHDQADQAIGVIGVATDITERVWAEEARLESEQQFVATFEQAAVGIALIGLGGLWIQVNQRLCAILGYNHDELLTRTYQDVTGSDDLQISSAVVRQMLSRELHTYRSEKRCVRRDGSEVWINVTISLLRTANDAPKYFIAVVEDITERKRAEAENTELTEALRIERDRLLRREVEVRTQIGRDLHDGPVQQVAVAALMVQYVRRVAKHAPDQLNTAFSDLEDQLRRTTHDLRTVLYELRPLGIVEEGVVGVLQQYVSRIRDTCGFRIHFDAPAALLRLSPERESAMFIIMQEALNNIRKHAQAQDVWLSLSSDETGLYAQVRDNGRGFDVASMQSSYVQRGSFGLLNMSERAQLSSGTCVIESQPGQGTSIRIFMPLVAN